MVDLTRFDTFVVGSGPNGLAAAIESARRGRRVCVLEATKEAGGGARTGELTLPGFRHDLCSAVHPLAQASPFFRTLTLERYDLQWIEPEIAVAHPLQNGVVYAVRSLDETCRILETDGATYRRLMEPFVSRHDALIPDLLAPLHWPRLPWSLLRFGRYGVQSAVGMVGGLFSMTRTGALFAGLAAHSCLSLREPISAAFGIVLGLLVHVNGWPIPRGGAGRISGALCTCLEELGGVILTDCPVVSLARLPRGRVLLDLTPRQAIRVGGDRFSPRYRRRLARYRYGPGVFKMDWALSEPIPWSQKPCRRAGTVHLGGTAPEIVDAEDMVTRGGHPERPFVILSQPTLFDPSRAPEGKHIAWAYTHVPNGSSRDMSSVIEAQIERFAPGFRDCILARHTTSCRDLEQRNANCVGGDINGGRQDYAQLFSRPILSTSPYRTSDDEIFLCSAATPPGGGVHGMCGYHAVQSGL